MVYTDLNKQMSSSLNHNNHNQLKLLIIDTDEKLRRRLVDFLSPLQIEILEGAKISEIMKQNQVRNNVLVLAITTPDEKRIQYLRQLKKSIPRMSIVILASPFVSSQLLKSLEDGTIDYICSRNNLASIYSAVKAEISRRLLKQENEYYLKNLTKLKLEHSRHIRKMLELEEIYDTTVENLMTALDLRDVETFGHSRTVSKYSQILAEILGIKNQTILDNIRKGALLHDIGKIAIPDSILKKPGQLTAEEWEKIKLHPVLGFGLIKEMKLLKEVGNIILYHHEKYDGSGYPRGLKNDDIPLEARIFALADALDAITSHRPYRPEKGFLMAREEILKYSGSQFDPLVVKAFSAVEIEHWERIRYETTKLLPSFEEYQQLLKNKSSS